jgi:hypothetical protein
MGLQRSGTMEKAMAVCRLRVPHLQDQLTLSGADSGHQVRQYRLRNGQIFAKRAVSMARLRPCVWSFL